MPPPHGQPLMREKNAIRCARLKKGVPFLAHGNKLIERFNDMDVHRTSNCPPPSHPPGHVLHNRNHAEFEMVQQTWTQSASEKKQPTVFASLFCPLELPIVIAAEQVIFLDAAAARVFQNQIEQHVAGRIGV